ncbi:MAG: hypothetical protein ACQEXQ_25055 [Bacillota bacterium]
MINYQALKNKNNLKKILIFLITSIAFISLINITQHIEEEGLDPSWRAAYNYFTINEFQMGSDVIFTYGPLAAYFSKIYTPELYWEKIIASTFVAIIIAIQIFLIANKKSMLASLLLLVGYIINLDHDTFYFSIQLGFLFLIFLEKKPIGYRQIPLTLLTIVTISCLGYVKFTFFVTGLFVMFLLCLYYVYIKSYKRLLAIPIVYISFLVSTWLLAKQDLKNLYFYIVNSIQISSGYTAAMSLNGPKITLIVAILLSIVLILCVFFINKSSIRKFVPQYILMLALVGFGFVVWKEGFVRHDLHYTHFIGYITICAAFISILLFSSDEYAKNKNYELIKASVFGKYTWELTLKWPRGAIISILILTMAFSISMLNKAYYDSLLFIDLVKSKTVSIKENLISLSDLKNQINRLDKEMLNKKEKYSMSETKRVVKNSSIDIYNYNQYRVLMNDMNWLPRPIFQSYSSYTSKLLELNEDSIERIQPDYLLFNLESIDNRLPFLDDNLWLRKVLHYYKPLHQEDGYLLLEKDREENVETELKLVNKKEIKFNQEYIVESINSPLYITIDIQSEFLGSIKSLLLKPSIVFIELTLKDGERKTYRIIPEMISKPTLLTPHITNNEELLKFFEGQRVNEVYSFKVVTNESSDYKSGLNVSLYSDDWKPKINTEDTNRIMWKGIFEKYPESITAHFQPHIVKVFNKDFLFLHPNAEVIFQLTNEKNAQVDLGLLPEVKNVKRSNGSNFYWDAEIKNEWRNIAEFKLNPEIFDLDFHTFKTRIPEGAEKIRLRIDGGINNDINDDWSIISNVKIY